MADLKGKILAGKVLVEPTAAEAKTASASSSPIRPKKAAAGQSSYGGCTQERRNNGSSGREHGFLWQVCRNRVEYRRNRLPFVEPNRCTLHRIIVC